MGSSMNGTGPNVIKDLLSIKKWHSLILDNLSRELKIKINGTSVVNKLEELESVFIGYEPDIVTIT